MLTRKQIETIILYRFCGESESAVIRFRDAAAAAADDIFNELSVQTMQQDDFTDLERFIALYRRVGIDVMVTESADGSKSITLEAKSHKKLVGYSSFFSEIVFSQGEKFREQGFWE